MHVYVMNTLQQKVGQLNDNISSIFFSGPIFFLSIYTRNWQISCYVRDLLKCINISRLIFYITAIFSPYLTIKFLQILQNELVRNFF